MFKLSTEKQKVIDAVGNILVTGGPGSGKTTIALLKARHIINSGDLQREQKILFLSFARATISRVEQHAKSSLGTLSMVNMEIATYHSFMWSILKSHGYLLTGKNVRLLPPHEATVRLSGIKSTETAQEKERLFADDSLLHFDLFASKCAEVLKRSQKLLKIISRAYPVIILDEFQDTNASEWDFISLLGANSTMIVLADPEQRIYDFKGADPKRIGQFVTAFDPQTFDFGTENNRSNGTDILEYGNDLLTGRNKEKEYSNVTVLYYQPFSKNNHLIKLKCHILSRLKANKDNPGWSLAVLVPSNTLMITISDFLEKKQILSDKKKLPTIHHEVAVETAGPILASILIAKLMDEGSRKVCTPLDIIPDLCEHILGRRGDNKAVPQNDQKLTKALMDYAKKNNIQAPIRGAVSQRIIAECQRISSACNRIVFTGDVAIDWISVRSLFNNTTADCVKRIYDDSMFIKLLRKGSSLNNSLGQIWRGDGNYIGASTAIKNAIKQEHFATTTKTWDGINVMTIHKAKGKEFDEVIIYDGAFPGQRIVYKDEIDKARINLRVAVTRAKSSVIILTPQTEPCCLL